MKIEIAIEFLNKIIDNVSRNKSVCFVDSFENIVNKIKSCQVVENLKILFFNVSMGHEKRIQSDSNNLLIPVVFPTFRFTSTKFDIIHLNKLPGSWMETDYPWSAAASPMSSWHAAAHGENQGLPMGNQQLSVGKH